MASSASPACDELAVAAERGPADTTVGSHVMRTMTCLLLALVTSTVLVVAPRRRRNGVDRPSRRRGVRERRPVLGGVADLHAELDCGPGRDLVGGVYALPGPHILLPAQCERVSVDASVEMTTHLRRVRGALCFTVFSNVSPARTVRVTVHDARTRTLLAKGRARIPGRRAGLPLASRAYVCRPPHATARSAAPAEGHLQRPRLRDQLDLWVTRIAEPLRFHTS